MKYPLRHVSIRVPWHDTGWDGRVCKDPRLNGACLKLKRIAENRDDHAYGQLVREWRAKWEQRVRDCDWPNFRTKPEGAEYR